MAVGLAFAGCLDWDELYGARCGDGNVSGDELCDDGNTAANDGCGPLCEPEPKGCGDGVTRAGEECDDANSEEDDACPFECRAARCGDGRLWVSVEDCDDGNSNEDDGCDNACRVDNDSCGNGTRDGVEECDDRNRENGDGCSSACKLEPAPALCGNARSDPDEACDDGNDENTDSCLNGCSLAACGDGFVWRGAEECDDGDTDNQDGCSRTCLACAHPDGALFRTANGHCYSLYPGANTLAEASAACDAAGGYIWTTTSAAEARDVNRNLVRSAAPFWLGYRTGPASAGWLTGESTSYQAWALGEPSTEVAGCVVQVADPAASTVAWRSAPCGDRYGFVCETQPALLNADTHHAYRL
ncbi:MAG TPA: DUF4215 domain-containing protein, partial [Polyangiaceae bacterium]|nr:DUF4215 domain-containing protein [Polyangiaceae bacterium]